LFFLRRLSMVLCASPSSALTVWSSCCNCEIVLSPGLWIPPWWSDRSGSESWSSSRSYSISIIEN
jgi:hypothetical protein